MPLPAGDVQSRTASPPRFVALALQVVNQGTRIELGVTLQNRTTPGRREIVDR